MAALTQSLGTNMLGCLNFYAVYRLLIALSLSFLCANTAFAQSEAHCSNDLMKLYRIDIPHAKLFKSETPTEPSQHLCTSVYKIPGKHAHATEALLIKKYGMGKLVFECCGWFPKNGREGYFRRSHLMANNAYAVYSISMSSEETVERQWDKIGSFYITLTIDAI